MHATRGWLGQTFALSKSNESGGRKSRIRRSKEERKEMVESFIKSYQKLNNGSFPSLNLTHKEVGGSFYTVREIVREIIQENRVLGPPKLPPGEQTLDIFLEQSPLGSISVDPLQNSLPSNETQFDQLHGVMVSLTHQLTSEEGALHSGRNFEHHYNSVGNVVIISGSTHATASNEKSEEPVYAQLLVERESESETDDREELDGHEVEKLITSQITEDVTVKTFPIKPVSDTFHELHGKCESEVVIKASEDTDVETMVHDLSRLNGKFKPELLDKASNKIDVDTMELEVGDDYISSLASKTVLNEYKSPETISTKVEEADLSVRLPEVNGSLVDEKSEATLGNCEHDFSDLNEKFEPEVVDKTSNEISLEIMELEAGSDYISSLATMSVLNENKSAEISTGKVVEADLSVRLPEVNGSLVDGESEATSANREHDFSDVNGKFEPEVIDKALNKNDVETMELEAGNDYVSSLASMTILNEGKSAETVSTKVEEADLSVQLPESNGSLVDEKSEATSENRDYSATAESITIGVSGNTHLEAEEVVPTKDNQPANVPSSIVSNNLNLNDSLTSLRQSIKEVTTENNHDIQLGDSSKKKETGPTVDRITLESCEKPKTKSARPESNSVVEFVKALVAAFVKFWSE